MLRQEKVTAARIGYFRLSPENRQPAQPAQLALSLAGVTDAVAGHAPARETESV